ncbi:SdpA family antimicrobial peptide system protein [Staphylococcus pseudoxylosus]|uniref:SdpA family antimicrobial peptide system protein n=1 Tax=Staphylococcus pseudoxylosus TaxID=2282419 RepID=UPI00398BA2D0
MIYVFKKQLLSGVGEKRNLFMGYRSFSSLKDNESWMFAQKSFIDINDKISKILIFIGILWTIYDVIFWLKSWSVYGQFALFLLSVFLIIIFTEVKVKNFATKEKNEKDIVMSKKSILIIIMFFIYLLVFFVSIMSIMKSNPISDFTQPANKIIHKTFPQGWAFYSKNPRSSTYSVIDTKSGEKAVQFPNSDSSNYFGFTRFGRSQGVEVGRLVSKIDKNSWSKTEKDPIEFGRGMKKTKIENDQIKPSIKGDILVYYTEPIPWSWSKTFSKENHMPSKIVRLEVE